MSNEPGRGWRLASGAVAILAAAGLAAHALVTARAWSLGTRGPFMPAWRAGLALGMVWLALRTFAGKRAAAQWSPLLVLPPLVATVLWALVGPAWAWAFVFILATHVAWTWLSLGDFPLAPPAERRRAARVALVAFLAIAGGEVYGHLESPGSARGRQLVVEEFERAYHEHGARDVHCELRGKTLVISSPTDPDKRIQAAARKLHDELAAAGPTARVWLVGFDDIAVVNTRIAVRIPASDFARPGAGPLERLFPANR